MAKSPHRFLAGLQLRPIAPPSGCPLTILGLAIHRRFFSALPRLPVSGGQFTLAPDATVAPATPAAQDARRTARQRRALCRFLYAQLGPSHARALPARSGRPAYVLSREPCRR